MLGIYVAECSCSAYTSGRWWLCDLVPRSSTHAMLLASAPPRHQPACQRVPP